MGQSAPRAVVLGDEFALFAGRLLAESGVAVTVVEPDGGSPLRYQPPWIDSNPALPGINWWNLTRCASVVERDLGVGSGVDAVRRLILDADILVESLGPGEIDRLGLGRAALAEDHPSLVQVSISPFGHDGDYAGWLGGDLIVSAMGGLLSLVGDADRAPIRIGSPQAVCHAGGQAFVAALVGRHEARRTGHGQRADVSAQAAVAWATHPTRQIWLLNQELTKRAGVRRPFGARSRRLIYPCADGYVAVQGVLGREWPAFVDWIAEDGLDAEFGDPKWSKFAEAGSLVPGSIPDQALEELDQLILPFFARRKKRDLYEGGQARRIIIFPVNTAADLFKDKHLRARGVFEAIALPTGRAVELPRPAIAVQGVREVQAGVTGPACRNGQPPAAPALAGLRVVDFSWVGAGPLTTTLLAMHGAEVIRIESTRRPDVLRVTPPYKNREPNIEGSGYYHPLNASKRDLGINLASPLGRRVAKRLTSIADIVVESFTPRVMAGWGLAWDDLKQDRPDLVMMSLSMVGQTGPYRDHLGFGTVLQASAGFPAITGWPDRDPVASGLAYTDWFVPLLAAPALLQAIEVRDATGAGQYIDCSQLEAALPFLGSALAEFAINGVVPGRYGNRLVGGGQDIAVPHGVFRCAGDDAWVAVACYTDSQWQALSRHVPACPLPASASLGERAAQREAIEGWLGRWSSQREPESAARELQAAGVPAGMVQDPSQTSVDQQLRGRGFGRELVHRSLGPMPYDPPAFRLDRTPAEIRPAPEIGQDTEWGLLELLGLTESDYEALWAEDALG